MLGIFCLMIAGTIAIMPQLGREFLPPLEEGHLFIRGMFPVSISLEQTNEKSKLACAIIRKYPEVELIVCQLGRPEAGTDPTGFYSSEFFVPLAPQQNWPAVVKQTGWRSWFQDKRPRTKQELIREMNAELVEALGGANWNFSQIIRDNVLEVLSGVQGENSVKIIGPDIVELEQLGNKVVAAMRDVPGIKDVGVYRTMGQCNLEFPIDRDKCSLWNVSVSDVHNVIQTAIGGKPISLMIEGEKTFDITIRWPKRLRDDESDILNIPVDVTENTVTDPSTAGMTATPFSSASTGVAPRGFSRALPSLIGSQQGSLLSEFMTAPRERLRDLVTPEVGDQTGDFVRPGASMISRDMGRRMIAVKFSVRDRDLAGAVDEAKAKISGLIPRGYSIEWSGEFQQMEDGERRLKMIIPLSLLLVFVLLYLAFNSILDSVVSMMNVVALSLGGIWALYLTGTNFSISAAVGFTSIFGLAIMDGLLLVSSFNQLRAQGLPLRDSIMQGAEKRVRPVTMTALTAIFGCYPLPFP